MGQLSWGQLDKFRFSTGVCMMNKPTLYRMRAPEKDWIFKESEWVYRG